MPAYCGPIIRDKLGAAEKQREMERELSVHGAAIILQVLDACGDNGRKRLEFMARSLSDAYDRGYGQGLIDGKKT